MKCNCKELVWRRLFFWVDLVDGYLVLMELGPKKSKLLVSSHPTDTNLTPDPTKFLFKKKKKKAGTGKKYKQ
jgi:hypothetical protein